MGSDQQPAASAGLGPRRRQEKIGIVTGAKMQKSVVVTVDARFIHPVYKRVIRRSKNFLAHDEKNQCKLGDTVRIQETRPLSRRKRWRVVQVLAQAPQLAPLPEGPA
jgi:small subunit ribosomal protein S17